jgi:hypothetical protein
VMDASMHARRADDIESLLGSRRSLFIITFLSVELG